MMVCLLRHIDAYDDVLRAHDGVWGGGRTGQTHDGVSIDTIVTCTMVCVGGDAQDKHTMVFVDTIVTCTMVCLLTLSCMMVCLLCLLVVCLHCIGWG